MKFNFYRLWIVMLACQWITGCASHCDSTKHTACTCPKLNFTTLPGRAESRVRQPYKAAVFGSVTKRPVLLLHDLNGASWSCLKLAEEISRWGFCVYVPNLFAGENMTFGSQDPFGALRYIGGNPDWKVHSKADTGPILEDLGCMTREISRRHGGCQIAVVGNCLMGIHPLGLLDETPVSKAVLCQPATPLKGTFEVLLRKDQHEAAARSLGLSEAELTRTLAAMQAHRGKQIAVLHYAHDPLAPMTRVNVLHEKLASHGMAGRMKTYVLQPETATSSPPTWWTRHDPTKAVKGAMQPHSTLITAANDCDLKWFRARLKEVLLTP